MKLTHFKLLAFIIFFAELPNATAVLIDNGDGTISDSVQQIMWTKDANLASPGNYTNAEAFIQNLNDTNYAGYSDWRLPSGIDPRHADSVATTLPNDNQYYYDAVDTEFGHLFYNELGGCSGWHITTKCVGYFQEPQPNDDPDLAKFTNLPPHIPVNGNIYWSGMASTGSPGYNWTFNFDGGVTREQPITIPRSFRTWAVRDAEIILPSDKQGIVLLHDLSGSMRSSHTGSFNPPPEQQRIYHAKRAANFFLTLLNIHATTNTYFGVAAFPQQPWTSGGCVGSDVTGGIQLFDDAFYNTVTNTTIPDLTTSGGTPMLAGLDTAAGMLTASDLTHKTILLLSDGYHNCPSSISAGGPEVTTAINEMTAQGIRVSAIGFSRPEDIDENLLTEISAGTSGHYYGVTGAMFGDPVWEPDLALESTYTDILKQDLGFQGIVDPVKVIEKDKPETIPAPLSDADKIVTFYASWTGNEENRVNISLRSSDGLVVPATGLKIKKSANYTMMSVSSSFLSEAGKIGEKPWSMVLSINPKSDVNSAPVLYGVIATSELKLKAGFEKKSYLTGNSIRLTATLSQSGKRLQNVTEITGYLSTPAIGRGEWFAKNSGDFIKSVKKPYRAASDPSPPLQRLARFINKIKKVKFPQRSGSNQIKFVDDGSKGDIKANDGIYTALITNTEIEGSYIAQVVAQGKTKNGIPFRRETKLSTFVEVGVSPEHSMVAVAKLDIGSRVDNLYTVKFRPLDKFGKNLGPGYANKMSLATNSGKALGVINDHLNGEYSAVVRLDHGVKPEQVIASIGIGKVAIVRNMTGQDPSKTDPLQNILLIIFLIILAVLIFIFIKKVRRFN